MISPHCSKYSLYEKPVEEWKVILELADKFNFPEIKELCVRELQKKSEAELPLVERIALYARYKVNPSHIVPLYAELCKRDMPLTLIEAKMLGMEATIIIANTREVLRAKPSDDGRSPLPEGMETGDVYRAIERGLRIKEGATEQFRKENGIMNSEPADLKAPLGQLLQLFLSSQWNSSFDILRTFVQRKETPPQLKIPRSIRDVLCNKILLLVHWRDRPL